MVLFTEEILAHPCFDRDEATTLIEMWIDRRNSIESAQKLTLDFLDLRYKEELIHPTIKVEFINE